MAKKTIEAKYEELRKASREAEDRVEAVTGDRSRGGPYVRDVVARHATAIAAERWPETRAGIAAVRGQMPAGPCVYGETQYGVGVRYGTYSTLARDRPLTIGEDDDGIVEEAEALARVEFVRVANATRRAYERYRLAVAQGVAVAPGEEETEQ